jgi:hypothetical protein
MKVFVQDNPCRHPVLILNDIHVDVLEALMTYMYQGTVSVPHNKLQVITSILKAITKKNFLPSIVL